jgi:hypothetical protein
MAEDTLVQVVIEGSIPLKGGIGKDGCLQFVIAYPQIPLVRFRQHDRLGNDTVEGLPLEIDLLEQIVGETIAVSLAVKFEQVLVFVTELSVRYPRTVYDGDRFSLLPPPHGSEVENKDDDNNTEHNLHEPVFGVFPHQLEHIFTCCLSSLMW